MKCKIEGTETNLTIHTDSFNDFSSQIKQQAKCRNFLASYENKGKSGEKTLVSKEDDFKSYLKIAEKYNTLPLTIKLIMEEERTNKTLLESEKVLISDDKQNIRSNNLKRPKTIEENDEDEMKNENDGKYFLSRLSNKHYAFESGDEEEKKNNKDESATEKEDTKKKESNLSKYFQINDNIVQSEEGEEVENDNNIIKNFNKKLGCSIGERGKGRR